MILCFAFLRNLRYIHSAWTDFHLLFWQANHNMEKTQKSGAASKNTNN
jgi:hypothetical protein